MGRSRRFVLTVILLMVVLPLFAGSSVSQPGESCASAEKKTVVDKDQEFRSHIKYTFQFSEEERRFCVLVENKGQMKTPSGFDVAVDGRTAAPEMPTLNPGESKYVTKDISRHLDVKRDEHSVILGVFGTEFQYNFTEELNATSPDVPAPYIKSVEVVRNDGNNSASLRVDVHNPTERGYGLYVQAKTLETKRVDEIGAPQENETMEFELPLEESSSEVVAGKVRIFDNWGEPEGKFDQKEFLAKPGNDTQTWDDKFENMPGVGESPDYSNETARQYREGYVDHGGLSPIERQVGAVLTVLLIIGSVWWRRR